MNIRSDHLHKLNPAQRAAVEHGIGMGQAGGPLLIIAGAGTGKTKTLAHRVAHIILNGVPPERLLLLTFTRRAAVEMTRRAQRILGEARAIAAKASSSHTAGEITWSGTFHGIANRLLRLHADTIGLNPAFTVLDRSDAADLIDLVRNELGLAQRASRFPKKDTCLAIYSYTVNARCELRETLTAAYPWCVEWENELKELFRGYVMAKQHGNMLDYDDLILYWSDMMAEPSVAAQVAERFDYVLVDEYQDTNALQAAILLALKPDGSGLTVVGDDAQSIYAFRAATVRNILDFPDQFSPPAAVLRLEQNYRSTQPILDASNAVIALAAEGFAKRLFSAKASDEKPALVAAADETAQVNYVVERILEHREAGIELQSQAVLFRAAHHSAALEVELTRRNIPFVKYGGLKFLEAAHIKDVICIMRWAENRGDTVAAFRALQLLPGIGPKAAQKALAHLSEMGFAWEASRSIKVPLAAVPHWPAFCALMHQLSDTSTAWPGQMTCARQWYQPHLERLYDQVQVRAGDLEKLEQISAGYVTRERFLSDMALDPPEATGAQAGAPLLDEDYLILSTIHSAKGQEWDAVYILNLADGCIPSDLATGSTEQTEEERRLLYVAMTRAKQHLHLIQPLRFFRTQQHKHGDGYMYAPRSRFIPDGLLRLFDCQSWPTEICRDVPSPGAMMRRDVGARMRDMWR